MMITAAETVRMSPQQGLPQIIYARNRDSAISDECDCACAGNRTFAHSYQVPATSVVDDSRLQSSPLHIQFLEPGYWLVFNPFSDGGVILVNEAALQILNFFELPHRPYEALYAFQELFQAQIQKTLATFLNLRVLHIETESKLGKPCLAEPKWLTIWLHVTNECNLRCKYCYLRKTPDKMSPEVGKQALEVVFRAAEKHQFEGIKIKYAGGEATLNFHRIIELHQYAQTLAQRYPIDLDEVILSNGVGITSAMIDALKYNGIRLMISLDGIGEYHDAQRGFVSGRGSFSMVAKTIDRLLQRGLMPHVSITVTDKNVDGLPQTVAYVLEHQLPFSLNFYRHNDYSMTFQDLPSNEQRMVGGMRQAFRVIERQMPRRSFLGSLVDRAQFITPHERTCGAGDSYLVIDQNGRIAKCHMEIEKSVTDIYAADPLEAIRADRTGAQYSKVDEKEGCRDCSWRYWCAGGCPVLTHRVSGRGDVRSPYCNVYQALYPDMLRLEGLRLLKWEMSTDSPIS
jgi:uncharacterized protein